MKVFILNDFGFVNGGASQVAILEALGLAAMGHEVTYFYAVGPLDERLAQHDNIQSISTNGQDILNDPNRFRAGVNGIWNTDVGRRLEEVLSGSAKGDTVVHLHGWSKALSAIVSQVVLKHQIPLVCTLHDYFIACPNGGFYKYPKEEICHLRPLSPACLVENCDARSYSHKLWRFCRTWVQRHIADFPNNRIHFVTVSDFSRKILEPFLPNLENVYVLPNPIEIEKAPPVHGGQNHAFTFVGRLSREKGPLLLGQANREINMPLTFVGDGELREKIMEENPAAILTGWLNREDVIRTLNQTRALVFPSKVYETQGMSVLEAAARGVPAIVSDTSAATDWVEDGKNGLWFRSGDANDLREKLLLLQDDALLERLGSNAFQSFWNNPFTPDRHVKKLIAIYERILARNSE